MNNIVAELVKILKSESSLLKKGQQINAFFVSLARQAISLALTQLDDELAQEKSQNQIHQKKQRTILTAFGEISYVRRYYRT
ncbi:UPF0236 family transposase-like protein, partial [Ligilactobacillus salitolerans]|uniref:UPF0236 family transposase-like protein n=1 Tax=Ligilactobacillus salitolerans TaxID=1808352 RepID=UPI00157FBC72